MRNSPLFESEYESQVINTLSGPFPLPFLLPSPSPPSGHVSTLPPSPSQFLASLPLHVPFLPRLPLPPSTPSHLVLLHFRPVRISPRHTHTLTHTHTHTKQHAHMFTHLHTPTHRHTHRHRHSHTDTQTHRHTDTQTHTHTHTHTHTRVHLCACARMCMCTCVRVHMCTLCHPLPHHRHSFLSRARAFHQVIQRGRPQASQRVTLSLSESV